VKENQGFVLNKKAHWRKYGVNFISTLPVGLLQATKYSQKWTLYSLLTTR